MSNLENIINTNYDNKIFKLGKLIFLLGVFFLPSALPIAIFCFLFALFIALIYFRNFLLEDKWNKGIVLCIFFMLFSSIYNAYLNSPLELGNFSSNISLINLFNWIPSLILFISFQVYLKSPQDRKNLIKFLISGTIPVIFSCILQLWFNIVGPFETLNGLIVWFQKPYEVIGGASGIFSNRNYLGFWLAVNLPFSFFLLRENVNKFSKIFIFITISFLFYLILFSQSRNAFISMIASILIYFGIQKSIYLLAILFVVLLLLKFFTTIFPNEALRIKNFLPTSILERITNINKTFNSPRIATWKSALFFIGNRPLFGWGAGAFATLYISDFNPYKLINSTYKAQHSHNLPIELALSFGIIVSLVLTITGFILFYKSLIMIDKTKLFNENLYLDKSWIAAITVILITHTTDITLFDGKISILIAILFAGLRCLLEDLNKLYKKDNEIYN